MTCDQAIELLPWLLNGTLDDEERRQVQGHLAGCSRCRAALADTRAAWEIFDWHPPAAALIAHAGSHSVAGEAGEPGAIEEHLAACPRCASEMELVRTSRLLTEAAEEDEKRIAILQRPAAKVPAPAFRAEPAAASRAWRRSALAAGLVSLLALTGWLESARHARTLERRLAGAGAATSGTSPSETAGRAGRAEPAGSVEPAWQAEPAGREQPAQRSAAAGRPQGAADSVSAGTFGEAQAKLAALASDNQRLQQRVTELGRSAAELSQRSAGLAPPPPRIESDVWVEELSPAEQVQRGGEAAAPEVIPLSAGAATLLLKTRHEGDSGTYEIEINDAQGRPVGGATRVLPRPGGGNAAAAEFDITLRRGALAPGAYTIHLFSLAGGGRAPLGTYPIRVS